jgi:hypothetical protein
MFTQRESGVTFVESVLNACREWFMSRNERLFEVEQQQPGKPSTGSSAADSSANDQLPTLCTDEPRPPTRNASKWIAFVAFVAELFFQVILSVESTY